MAHRGEHSTITTITTIATITTTDHHRHHRSLIATTTMLRMGTGGSCEDGARADEAGAGGQAVKVGVRSSE